MNDKFPGLEAAARAARDRYLLACAGQLDEKDVVKEARIAAQASLRAGAEHWAYAQALANHHGFDLPRPDEDLGGG